VINYCELGDITGDFKLICSICGKDHNQGAMGCSIDGALLRTEYAKKMFSLSPFPGIWRYLDWLPVSNRMVQISSGPKSYHSIGLAHELGLDQLTIGFNGYWPERAAEMRTGSFKELEALPAYQRIVECGNKEVLVLASAGNTARAFSYVASMIAAPCVVVVPRSTLDSLWLPGMDKGPIIVVGVDGDYAEAIELAAAMAPQDGFIAEGGANNIARRDGMGTVILDAVRDTAALPDHYFQAVGSGTGGIGAFEASLRLIGDGRFGNKLPRLHLAQNTPCAPLYHGMRGEACPDACPEGIYDEALFNRTPPLFVGGGVQDALLATEGEVIGVEKREAVEAKKVFEQLEGIDILPAAAVAVAALIQSVEAGKIKRRDRVLLNITGGGVDRVKEEFGLDRIGQDMSFRPGDDVIEMMSELREALGLRT
jgi:cysteate synthase